MEHLQSEEPFSSDPYFTAQNQAIVRDIHIECSKQFKWNLYFYVAILGSAKTALKFKYVIWIG